MGTILIVSQRPRIWYEICLNRPLAQGNILFCLTIYKGMWWDNIGHFSVQGGYKCFVFLKFWPILFLNWPKCAKMSAHLSINRQTWVSLAMKHNTYCMCIVDNSSTIILHLTSISENFYILADGWDIFVLMEFLLNPKLLHFTLKLSKTTTILIFHTDFTVSGSFLIDSS